MIKELNLTAGSANTGNSAAQIIFQKKTANGPIEKFMGMHSVGLLLTEINKFEQPLLVLDDKKKIVGFNEKTAELFGWPSGQPSCKSFAELFTAGTLEIAAMMLYRAAAGKPVPASFMANLETRSGAVPVAVSIRRLPAAPDVCIMEFLTLADSTAALEKKENLISNLRHNLKTPINSAISVSQTIIDESAGISNARLKSDLQETCRLILEEAQAFVETINLSLVAGREVQIAKGDLFNLFGDHASSIVGYSNELSELVKEIPDAKIRESLAVLIPILLETRQNISRRMAELEENINTVDNFSGIPKLSRFDAFDLALDAANPFFHASKKFSLDMQPCLAKEERKIAILQDPVFVRQIIKIFCPTRQNTTALASPS